MELTFPTSNIQYLDTVLREVRCQEQNQEIRLSDGMPDIGRVIGAWGMPVIHAKEWRRSSVAASGGIMVWVLYAPEDGTDTRCMESWIPFQLEWDIRDTEREGKIRLLPLLRFVDARAVSARKLMLRTGVAVMAEALVTMEAQIPVPGTVEDDIQLRRATYPVRLVCKAGEKAFVLDEVLSVPSSVPVPDKLIRYAVQPEISEQRVSGDRVVFRGNANLRILYRCEEGKLHTWDFELPFSQLGDLEESLEEDALADLILCVTGLEAELDDQKQLRVKCGLVGQYAVSCQRLLELTEDAYGLNRDVVPQMRMLELPVILENRQENLYGEQSVPQDGSLIVDVSFQPDFPQKRGTADGVELEIPGRFQVLYYDGEGMLQSAAARWERGFRLPAGEGVKLDVSVLPCGSPHATFAGGQMQMKGNICLKTVSRSDQGLSTVTALEVGQPQRPDPGRPSLILRRVGEEGLWQVAKQTGSTVEAIRRANQLQDEPELGQMLLIPVS